MRQFLDGNGSNSTALVLAHLAAHRQLHIADLYIIHTAPNFVSFPMEHTFMVTDYPSPLHWTFKGTFIAGGAKSISRGEVESKVGLEVSTLDINWSPDDSNLLCSVNDTLGHRQITALQGFRLGCYDHAIVEVWRCLMPEPGDCDTLGACLLFAGRVGPIEVDRMKAKITISSRTALLNIQIPTNTIEPQNMLVHYAAGQVWQSGPAFPGYQITGGTDKKLEAVCDLFAGIVVPPEVYDGGYIVMTTGPLAGTYRRVQHQETVTPGVFIFHLDQSLGFTPTPRAFGQVGDFFMGYISIPLDRVSTATDQYAGFPFVPSPMDTAVVLH